MSANEKELILLYIYQRSVNVTISRFNNKRHNISFDYRRRDGW